MLILVPWKPVVFVWSALTVMILLGYAVYCLQEGKNPFSVQKNHSRYVLAQEQKHAAVTIRRARHDRSTAGRDSGCAVVAATTHSIERP